MSREAVDSLLQQWADDVPQEEEFEGVTIRGLTAAQYRKLQGMKTAAALKSAEEGSEREEGFQQTEQLGYLTLGVAKPALTIAEWREVTERIGAGKIDKIVERIKTLGGESEREVEVAKKVSEKLLGGSPS